MLLAVNALLVDGETKSAEVTVPGGRILELAGGDMQVVERGPRRRQPDRPRPLLHLRDRLVGRDDARCSSASTGWSRSTCSATAAPRSPSSGYSIDDQAALVAEALARLGVRDATVVGHSLGGTVAIALAEQSPAARSSDWSIIDQAPNNDDYEKERPRPSSARLAFLPVIGQALWRIKPDFAIEDGLEVAFAPGFDVPDAFVEDVRRG